MGVNLNAQEDWIWNNHLPPGYILRSVVFVDQNIGWAVGGNGEILKTIDGGESWVHQESGTSNQLFSVQFVDENNGWISGASGTILKSLDGGSSWTEKDIGTSGHIYSLFFTNLHTGYAVGSNGRILKSNDGGNSWITQDSEVSNSLYSVYFVTQKLGWVVGTGGIILNTTDGGESWSSHDSGMSGQFRSIFFIDENHGWAVGGRTQSEYSIFKTANGGESWSEQAGGEGSHLWAVNFVSQNIGWTVGESGSILHTTDGGENWISQKSGTDENLYSVQFIDQNTGWAVGTSGTILKTTNGGEDWITMRKGAGYGLVDVYISYHNTAVAVGGPGTILKTTDGGKNWVHKESGTNNWLHSVHFIDHNTGFAVGNNGTILKTTDGGETWTTQDSGTSNYLRSVYFIDEKIGWVVGYFGTILKTIDGGDNWTRMHTGLTRRQLIFIQFVDDEIGFIVGSNGMILKTINGGDHWIMKESGTIEPIDSTNSAHFIDHNVGYAVGINGAILRTTDGGEKWTQLESGTKDRLWDVHFVDKSNGWVVGSNGIILRTTDGGDSWAIEESGTNNWLRAVHFKGQNAFVVGSYGTILKYTGKDLYSSIQPISSSNQYSRGTTFWIDVEVGNPNEVLNLYGVSFKIKSDQEFCTYVDDSAEAGDFLGNSILFFSQKVDPQTVDITVTKTSGDGEDGSGIVARAEFTTPPTLNEEMDVTFSIDDVSGVNPDGDIVPLFASTFTVTITVDGIVVYPGDTNNDGIVTASDLLPIGLYYGQSGPEDNNPGIQWQEYVRDPWPADEDNPRRIYADANGDGIINAQDVLAIGLNYGKTQPEPEFEPVLYVGKTSLKEETGEIGGTLGVSVIRDEYDTNEIELLVQMNSVKPVYGISFKVQLDDATELNESYTIDVSDGVLGEDVLQFSKLVREEGFIDIGLSRKEGEGFSGDGELMRLVLNHEYPEGSNIGISLEDINAIDDKGNSLIFTSESVVSITDNEHLIPTEFSISQNYPNPFNPVTTIDYGLPNESHIMLVVYDMLGREVTRLVNETQPAGMHRVNWDSSEARVSSGIYIYRIAATSTDSDNKFIESKRMVLMK